MTVSNELIDSLLADYKKPEDLIGEHGLLKQLTRKLIERALEAEMAEHLGHARNEPVANPAGNTRNGKSKKTLKGVNQHSKFTRYQHPKVTSCMYYNLVVERVIAMLKSIGIVTGFKDVAVMSDAIE